MRLCCIALLVLTLSACETAKPVTESPEAAEIRTLKAQVAVLQNTKPPHQFQLITQGERTWRFDPVNGEMCIQLTTKSDWKLPATVREGCQYADWTRRPDGATDQDVLALNRSAECILVGVKDACKYIDTPAAK